MRIQFEVIDDGGEVLLEVTVEPISREELLLPGQDKPSPKLAARAIAARAESL